MAGPIRIAILANGSQARREISQTTSSLTRLGGLAKSAAAVGFGALIYGAASFAKSSIDVERKFSTSMRLIQASTKAPAADMAKLNDLAIKLGQDTSFSAGEAADAMLELAKAGLSTKTIMGGGLAGTLTLAAAGGTDLATASTIAANAMQAFNLQGKDMDKIAAALAGGANASTASVESLGQALQQVGPGATNAGLSLNETVAALSAFDAAGIKGSDAGTSLKTMLTRLVPQTEKASTAMEELGLEFTNADGSFKSLTEISEQLATGLADLSQEERTRALATIFGSDATRAATVLFREGAEGIKGYIKATRDTEAANKMAAARMGGTEGALERLSGTIETAKLRLGQELAPVVVKAADALGDKLVPALEGVIDGAKDIGHALAPAAEEIAEALGNMAGEGEAAGEIFNGLLIPALKTAAELVAFAVDAFDSLPGPVKEFAFQAGAAALILPKLNAALLVTQARLTGLATTAATSAGRMAFLTSGLKKAAGIGGVLGLTDAFTKAADEGAGFGSVLEGLGSGAALGFAAGGPWGALIGAVGGAGLVGLAGAFADTEEDARQARLELLRTEGFENARQDADSLAMALQGAASAFGKVTRASVEASFIGEDGKVDSDVAALRAMGVSMDTIVSATLGQADALKIVASAQDQYIGGLEGAAQFAKDQWDAAKDGAIDYVSATGQVIENGQHLNTEQQDVYEQAWLDAKQALDEAGISQDNFTKRVEESTGAIADHRAKMAELADLLGINVKQYKDWPKEVRTRFESAGLVQTNQDALKLIGQYKGLQRFGRIKTLVSAPNIKLTGQDVLKLQRLYKLTPKQVRTLFKQEKIPTSVQSVAKLTKAMKATPKEVKSIIKLLGLDATVGQVKRAQQQLKAVGREKPKPVLSADDRLLQQITRAAVHDVQNLDRVTGKPKIDVQSNASQRAAETNSVLSRIPDEYVNVWVVRHDAGGGNRGTGTQTPTPKTVADSILGPMPPLFTEIEARGKQIVDALADVMAKPSGRRNIIDKILRNVIGGSSAINSALDRLTQLIEKRIKGKGQEKREKAILSHLADEYKALRRNGREQDRINRKLEKARAHLEEVQTWADAVKQTFIDTGNITQLGLIGDRTVSSRLLIDQLRDKVKDAQRFAELIRELSDDAGVKLNQTSLQQLLDAGPEAGLETVEALVKGGDEALNQVNDLTQQLLDAGGSLGSEMSDQFFDVGLQAAEGIVKGLEAAQDRLDRIADRLADKLAQAIKDALGGRKKKKGKKEREDDMRLLVGADEEAARSYGERLAAAMAEGFRTPALGAFRTSQSAGVGQAQQFHFTFTAEALDQLRAGKTATAQVDASRARGVRPLAVGLR